MISTVLSYGIDRYGVIAEPPECHEKVPVKNKPFQIFEGYSSMHLITCVNIHVVMKLYTSLY